MTAAHPSLFDLSRRGARSAARLCAGLIAGIAGMGVLGSCQVANPIRPVIRGDVDPTGRAWPFAPTELRVYPLTRVDRDERGRPVVVVYLETVDRWGDFSKAIGDLELRLYAGDRAVGSADDTLELTWPSVRLSDLEENAAWYDPASKMYRFTLGGLNRSGTALGAAEALLARGDPNPPTSRIRIMAVLRTVGPDGREIFLQDSYTIER
ncbi:MAG: hypothetical protein KIT19_07075 [Phycisphaeraceae bacterium]|nr:hypothetical protein [Phycisphaeraceae bacterium]